MLLALVVRTYRHGQKGFVRARREEELGGPIARSEHADWLVEWAREHGMTPDREEIAHGYMDDIIHVNPKAKARGQTKK